MTPTHTPTPARKAVRTEPDVLGRPTRVVFCVDNLNVGGTELNAVRTAEQLDRARVEVSVLCLQAAGGPLDERYRAAGIPVHALPLASLYGPDALRQGWQVRRFLRQQRADVLHAHDVYSNIFGVPWARLAGVKTIASRRWWAGTPRPLLQRANRLAYALADVVLANAPAVAGYLREELGLPARKVRVVPNFVDAGALQPSTPEVLDALRRQCGVVPGRPTVGIVANLYAVKDHASLLRAAALLRPTFPALQLVLVGDGPERAPLQRLADELGLREHVVFAGRLPSAPSPHQLFDVSVLCSTSEGFSNSILEAMAAARPVVATRVGAAADAVVEGETGRLVPPREPQRLAAALGALLADPARARAMGAAGRERAQRLFSPAAALPVLEQLYRELAGGGRAAPAARGPRSLTVSR